MPGPAPKDPALRQRRNKTSTAATLSADHGIEAPPLPPRYRVDRKTGERTEVAWHPMALDLWEEVWASPMAPEYLNADHHGLYIITTLTDTYWKRLEDGEPVTGLAMEIRLQRAEFGLTPIARRRLQWEVEKTEEALDRGSKRSREREAESREKQAAKERAEGDPRRLMLVS